MITIDKNVPMPDTGVGRPKKYPWADMEIGDSFLVPCEQNQRVRIMNSLSCCRNAAERKLGDRKFTLRQVEDGVRAWRFK